MAKLEDQEELSTKDMEDAKVSEESNETEEVEALAAKIKREEGIANSEEPDDKGEAEGDEKADQKAAPKETPKEKALRQETARLRKKARDAEERERVHGERIAKLEGQLESRKSSGGMADYTDKDLVRLQMQWEDARDTAKAGDDPATLDKAKRNIEAIRVELHERSLRANASAFQEQTENDAVYKEAVELTEKAVKAFPDLQDEDSDLFKAADAKFKSAPRLMKKLGVFSDMVAAAAAIMDNPELLGKGKEKAARKEVLKNIEKAADKALKAGTKAESVKTVPNVDKMSTDEIEAMAQRIKSGESLEA